MAIRFFGAAASQAWTRKTRIPGSVLGASFSCTFYFRIVAANSFQGFVGVSTVDQSSGNVIEASTASDSVTAELSTQATANTIVAVGYGLYYFFGMTSSGLSVTGYVGGMKGEPFATNTISRGNDAYTTMCLGVVDGDIMNGCIDNLIWWDRCLSAEEVAKQRFNRSPVSYDSLNSWYRFDSPSDMGVDSGPYGLHLIPGAAGGSLFDAYGAPISGL